MLPPTSNQFHTPSLAAVLPEPPRTKPKLAREATGLWGTLALLLLVVVIGLALIALLRRAARLRADANRTPIPTPHIDAWAEAGKRITTDEHLLHGPERIPKNPPPDTPESRGNYQPPSRP